MKGHKRVPVYTKARYGGPAAATPAAATPVAATVNFELIASVAVKSLAVLFVLAAAAFKLLAILLNLVFKVVGGHQKDLMRSHRRTSSW